MGIFDKVPLIVGNLKRILALPCANNPSIWVQAAEEITLRALYTYISPDAREYYHHAKGESLLCSLKKAAKDLDYVPPEDKSKATRWLFKELEWADRIIWYSFIIPAIEDAIYQWSSNALRMYCNNKQHSQYYGDGDSFFGGLNINGDWQTADFYMNAPSMWGPVHPSSIVVQPGAPWYIAAMAQWRYAHLDTKGTVETRIYAEETGAVFDTQQEDMSHLEHTATHTFASGKNETDIPLSINQEWRFLGSQSEPGTAAVLVGGYCSLLQFPS